MTMGVVEKENILYRVKRSSGAFASEGEMCCKTMTVPFSRSLPKLHSTGSRRHGLEAVQKV
jgi:hypothetical protein